MKPYKVIFSAGNLAGAGGRIGSRPCFDAKQPVPVSGPRDHRRGSEKERWKERRAAGRTDTHRFERTVGRRSRRHAAGAFFPLALLSLLLSPLKRHQPRLDVETTSEHLFVQASDFEQMRRHLINAVDDFCEQAAWRERSGPPSFRESQDPNAQHDDQKKI